MEAGGSFSAFLLPISHYPSCEPNNFGSFISLVFLFAGIP